MIDWLKHETDDRLLACKMTGKTPPTHVHKEKNEQKNDTHKYTCCSIIVVAVYKRNDRTCTCGFSVEGCCRLGRNNTATSTVRVNSQTHC